MHSGQNEFVEWLYYLPEVGAAGQQSRSVSLCGAAVTHFDSRMYRGALSCITCCNPLAPPSDPSSLICRSL